MLQNAPKCSTSLHNAPQSSTILQAPPKWSTMLHKNNSSMMLQNTPECSRMLKNAQNAPECSRMLLRAPPPERSRMVQDAPGCSKRLQKSPETIDRQARRTIIEQETGQNESGIRLRLNHSGTPLSSSLAGREQVFWSDP